MEALKNVRKMAKLLRRLLLLLILLAVAGIGYMYLKPLMTIQEEVSYSAFTVRRGDISTDKSFSASISVAYSEKHQNTTRATAIREIYVTSGQQVRKGDKLMLLDNGELLKAGLDGVVTELRFDTSDWLWNNVDLIQINDLTHLKVSLSVDEYDVRNVTAGQKCFVTIVPTGEVFETEISHVDRVSSSSGQVAYYTASAELTAPESVMPGMTASVTIPSDHAEDVLLLDMAALSFDEEKNPYVLNKTETGYERIPVTTGLSNGMQVEILSGLRDGDVVWAVSGTETVQSAYTLVDLYRQLAGEKVVIKDMTGGGQNGRNGFSGFPMPSDNQAEPEQDNETDGSRGMPAEGTQTDGSRGIPAENTQTDGSRGMPAAPAQNEESQASEETAEEPSPSREGLKPSAGKEETDEAAVDHGARQNPATRNEERKETP